MREATARLRAVVVGALVWCGIGALVAGLITLATNARNAFAITGVALVALGVGWTIGPFKAPMTWTEGTLLTYEGNASPDDPPRGSHTRRVLFVPAYAFAAGLLLLATAGLWVAAS